MELKESGYTESSNYLQDLIYDNVQLVNEDDLGIVVDLRKRHDYLQYMGTILQKAEKYHDRGTLKYSKSSKHLKHHTEYKIKPI